MLPNVSEIDFVSKDVDELLTEMVAEYEQAYYEQTQKQITLSSSDPVRIWIYSQALREYALYQLINNTAKMNLLSYATGNFLDNLGARHGEKGYRKNATSSKTTVKFNLSEVQLMIISIPKGTRVTAGDSIFFATSEYAEIQIGETTINIEVECETPGLIGNGYTAGQINTLVDPINYIESVSNIDMSQGGADMEDDNTYRERLHKLPNAYSTAGPSDAYEYFAKEYSSNITDVKVASPSAGSIDIRIILKDGELPDSTLLSQVQDYLSDSSRRPLTDLVTVQAPSIVNYDIALTYYIDSEDSANVTSIQSAVDEAVQNYITWQKSKIGRDINTSYLISLIIQAGAKRATVTLPAHTAIDDTGLAVVNTSNIVYGGLE